jgi:tRNA(Ile)-lysidine synthase
MRRAAAWKRLFSQWDKKTPWILGVSGGMDSMFLLHAMREAGFKNLIVCHLNHGLRENAGYDERLVMRQCVAYGVRCLIRRAKIAEIAARRHQSVETVARDVRRQFFYEIAHQEGAKGVFLAHHADDQAETLLLHLLRGCALTGLAGMAQETAFLPASAPSGAAPVALLRPLLGVRREEIQEYVTQQEIAYVTDESNDSLLYTRNRIRHILLPIASAIMQRDVIGLLSQTAQALRADEDLLASEMPAVLPEKFPTRYAQEPLSRFYRLLVHWLRQQGVPDISFTLLQDAHALCTKRLPAKLNLPGGRWLRRTGGVLWIEAPAEKPSKARKPPR